MTPQQFQEMLKRANPRMYEYCKKQNELEQQQNGKV